MYLSSSLEPSGPKSTDHYIILHHYHQRELIKMPKTYSDLQKEVERLFHIDDPQGFHVETKELNICVGKRIRVPEGLWGSIAELLGNVLIVPSRPLAGSHSLETEHQKAQPTPGTAASRVRFEVPNGPGHIPANGFASSSRLPATPQDGPVITLSQINKEELYHQIIACDPQNASSSSSALDIVRKTTVLERSKSGIKWHGRSLHQKVWTDFEWKFGRRSICVVRYTLQAESEKQFHIALCVPGHYSHWVHSDAADDNRKVSFSDKNGTGFGTVYRVITLEESIRSPGEHSVAFIHHEDGLRVLFDFKRWIVLPQRAHATFAATNPEQVFAVLDGKCSVTADVYEFE